jgi:hypothetical protein
MKYIDLPKPHGFLIWRGKQKAIGLPVPALSGQKVMVISDGEPYGEAVFGEPVEMLPAEFAKFEEHHLVRPEEKTLLWPNADKLYTQWIKDFIPYEDFEPDGEKQKRIVTRKSLHITGDEAELLDTPEPTEAQKELLSRAERLPKTIVLLDEAVTLEDGKAIIAPGCEACQPVLDAVLNGAKALDTSLHAYQLTLTRVPRLALKKKELEAMEGEKCGDMPMSYVPYGVYTFADLMAAHEAQETAQEIANLSQQFTGLVGNIMASPDVADKPSALTSLTKELAILMKQEANGEMAKSLDSNPTKEFPMLETMVGGGEKAKGGYLVSDDSGDHLPTETDGKVDPRLMGAAYAALTSNSRGNPYEGPNKAAALAKLKKLYKSEGMDLPGEKSSEVEEAEKAGRKVKGSMMDKIKAAYETLKDFVSWADNEPALGADDDDLTEKGIAIKQVNGKPWFISYSTNAFEDREREIFSTKALEKYVEEAELKSDRGYFNFWHIKTKANPALTDFAKKEWQAVVGRFLVEAGPFLDDEKGQAALKFFQEYPDGHPEIAPEGWGCSPEYRYLPEERKSGTYDNIWVTRTSTLPRLAAANIWTKGTTMAISEQQKQAANTIFGEELATKIFKSAEDATKELEEAGVAHKSAEDVPATEEPKPAGITLDDLQPFVEAMNLLATNQAELKELIATQASEIKQLKIAEAVKAKTETPRAQLFTLQRATEAQKTIITADDPLIPKQPEPLKDKSGAAHFFPQQ